MCVADCDVISDQVLATSNFVKLTSATLLTALLKSESRLRLRPSAAPNTTMMRANAAKIRVVTDLRMTIRLCLDQRNAFAVVAIVSNAPPVCGHCSRYPLSDRRMARLRGAAGFLSHFG